MRHYEKKVVLCGGTRTPIGHISRSLAEFPAQELMRMSLEATVNKLSLPKNEIKGVFVGWVGQDFTAANIARVAMLKAGFPEVMEAATTHINCLSSIESVSTAARRIVAEEGDLYIAGGVECMSRLPYTLMGSRASKELRNLDTIRAKWGELLESESVALLDSMEKGLTDPVENINMAATAEVAAQMYGIAREEQDEFAHRSFKTCVEAWERGFYKSHVEPIKNNGDAVLEHDEYPFLRKDLIAKPVKFSKAPVAFDNPKYSMKDFYRDYGKHMEGRAYKEGAKGTVTLFNSCGRSDAAASVVLASEEKAKALGLPIMAELKGWGYVGNNPAHMGVSPALAAPKALEAAGVKFEDLDDIELHEPFAATVLSIFKLGKERFGHDWQAKLKEGKVNPNGGSIAMGHPLGMTGARLVLNALHALQEKPDSRYGMAAACAGGGIGGALVFEKYS